MENFILKTHYCDKFNDVAIEAQSIAKDLNQKVYLKTSSILAFGGMSPDKPINEIVEFDFNDIKCLVSENTNLELLYRDYLNAHTMEWKTIGPDCLPEYTLEIYQELENKRKIHKEKYDAENKIYREKERIKKEKFQKDIDGIVFEFSNKENWDIGIANNQDSYGSAIYEYAEDWGKLMQFEMNNGKFLIECADDTSHRADLDGITGFMYGAAVSVLSGCWKYGEELRKWHNKEYNHEGDGVVNPAILTLSIPE